MRHLNSSLVILFFVLAIAAAPVRAGEPLVIGTDEWPPYEFTSHGKIRGIATDVLTAVLRMTDRPVKRITSYPWARGLHLLEGGRLDVLYSGIYDPARLAFARYHTEPLVESRWVLFTRRGDEFAYSSVADLLGRTVGVVRGYSYTPEINSIIIDNDDVVETSSDEDNLELLLHGRVDCVLCDELNCTALVNRMGFQDSIIQVPGPPLAHIAIYAMFNRERVPEYFVERFDEQLRLFKKSPAYGQILRKYLR